MKATASQQPIHSDWKILYRAAVLEPDKDVIRQKIAERNPRFSIAHANSSTAAEQSKRRNRWKTHCTSCARTKMPVATPERTSPPRPQKPPDRLQGRRFRAMFEMATCCDWHRGRREYDHQRY